MSNLELCVPTAKFLQVPLLHSNSFGSTYILLLHIATLYSNIKTLVSDKYSSATYPPATLSRPQLSTVNNGADQQLRLDLTRPEGYNSGRFILRYDCGLRGIPIELEYRSVEISGSSDVVVRRSRSCFVVGEISRVTVWFVSGGQISSTPTVVNVSSRKGEEELVSVVCIHREIL